MLENILVYNGKIAPEKKAQINIDNIEYAYGFGVYETLKVRNNKTFFEDEHINRILNSAQKINLEHKFNFEFIKESIKLLNKNIKEEAYNIKIMFIGGNPKLFVFAVNPFFITKKQYRDGVKIITHNGKRYLPEAKTLNMLESYITYKKAKEENAYDSIFINEGKVLEGTRTNIFLTDGKKVYTPKTGILKGVTRNNVIKALKAKGINVIERDIDEKELYENSCFLTSTSINVLPISKINDIEIEINSFVKEIMKIYKEYLQKQC